MDETAGNHAGVLVTILNFFDFTFLALWLPSTVLTVYLCFYACKKGVVLWPVAEPGRTNIHQKASKSVNTLGGPLLAINLYTSSFLLAFAIFSVSGHFMHLGKAFTHEAPFNALYPVLGLLIGSASISAIVFFLSQIISYKRITGLSFKRIFFSVGPSLNTFIFLGLVLYFFPLLHFASGTFGEPFIVLKNLFRICIALGSISLAMTAFLLVMQGMVSFPAYKKAMKKLGSERFRLHNLEDMSDDELHELIDVALRLRRPEQADVISHYVLVRAECDGQTMDTSLLAKKMIAVSTVAPYAYRLRKAF